MLFNSFSFLFFLIIVYAFYWLLFNRTKKARNAFILVASYFFYGCWDWRFLFLILFISLTDFYVGRWIHTTESPRNRKRLLVGSLVINIGLLGFFKYFNFFITSFVDLTHLLGFDISYSTLNIVLPVGISFFTFQGLSYVIDIYHRKLEPTKDVVAFCSFVAFFPQLVAGPIERAKDLLPQFTGDVKRIPFDYDKARTGLFLIVVGLFKKVVIADRLAIYVDSVYSNLDAAVGLPMVVAAIFFAMQLYLDFSAYSQIAIGTAQLFGIRLSMNFNKPYMSTSFKEFWSRWHISLTSWFRDYLYFPLGGNRKGHSRTIINVLIIFSVSGLWHGASWNFVIWGFLNGLALAVFDKMMHCGSPKHIYTKVLSCLCVVLFWTLTLVFFRADTFADAILGFSNMGFSHADALTTFGLGIIELKFVSVCCALLLLVELILKNREEKLSQRFFSIFPPIRWTVYLFFVLMIVYFGIYGPGSDAAFIYFQF